MPEDHKQPEPASSFETTPLSRSQASQTSGASGRHGRFMPGMLFGKRYRITGRLGQGGMGEVYGADDLELGQAVALKFLSVSLTQDESALEALRNEVRVARQIAHPNVCRVYDLHEIDGQHFVVMEYVDGEDLAGLLRRIGRLPGEKAADIIRQLAAGLCAAHEMGVLHRDLKPANVMIDGRGRVHIMDFGLAGFVAELRGAHPAAGTLAYMAPEQLAGEGPSMRSDVYSLGLVMYELLTGRRPYDSASLDELRERQASTTPADPSSLARDCDPLVERVVMRCLSFDPDERPASALAVAAALPGGDPLAAALAAGETPSPEMVAAAGGRGLLRPAIGVALLGAILLSFVAIALLNDKVALFRLARLEHPPVVLAAKARETLARLGFQDRPADVAYGWTTSYLLNIIESLDQSPQRWKDLDQHRPTAFEFWYREAAAPMSPLDKLAGRVSRDDPPLAREGMVQIQLDQTGRLRGFGRVAPFRQAPPDSANPVDWNPFFSLAEIDPAAFRQVEPIWNPHMAVADQRWAWEGFYPGAPAVPLRIEAGASGGRPAYFGLFDDGPRDWLLAPSTAWGTRPGEKGAFLIGLKSALTTIMLAACIFLPVMVAWRNLRARRADARSAFRFAFACFILTLISQVLTRSHSPDVTAELVIVLIPALLIAVTLGIGFALAYLAAEPYLRRQWPDLLISWTRLTSGRYRDPRVGRDILIGAAAGAAMVALSRASWFLPSCLGRSSGRPLEIDSGALLGGSVTLGSFFDSYFLLNSLMGAIILTLFLLLFRRKLPAVAVTFILLDIALTNADLGWIAEPAQLANFAADTINLALAFLVAVRVGLLALASFSFFYFRLMEGPVTLDMSSWYAGSSTLLLVALAAIALYAFRVATVGYSAQRPQT